MQRNFSESSSSSLQHANYRLINTIPRSFSIRGQRGLFFSGEMMGTTIEDLPNEMLLPILKNVPYKDRLITTNVSVRWNRLIDHAVGRKLFVGKSCQFTPDDEERFRHRYVDVEAIKEVGVSTCYVGEIVDKYLDLRGVHYYFKKLRDMIVGAEIPTFKYPHLVRVIYFDGPLPLEYFKAMLLPLFNLIRLDIHFSALSCLDENHLRNLSLPKLETLHIWGHKMSQGMFTTTYSSDKIISNLFALLENHFENLKNFAVEFPYDAHKEVPLSRAVLQFLYRHRHLLEKFKIEINLFATSETAGGIESVDEQELHNDAKQISKQIQLKSVELVISSLFQVRLFRIWTSFGEQQTNLQSFAGLAFKFQPDIIIQICSKNSETITSIWISRLLLLDNSRLTVIHCNIFEACKNLRSLLLEGMPMNLDQPNLVSCSDLPKSLEHLELGGLTIKNEDAKCLIRDFPSLLSINIGDAGTGNGMGFTVDDVLFIIREKRIKQVILYDSIAEPFPANGVPNGDPDSPSFITLFPYGILEMKLKEDTGYYENLSRETLEDILPEDI